MLLYGHTDEACRHVILLSSTQEGGFIEAVSVVQIEAHQDFPVGFRHQILVVLIPGIDEHSAEDWMVAHTLQAGLERW